MSRENYEVKEAILGTLSQDEIKVPSIPVDVSLQEAENLFEFMT